MWYENSTSWEKCKIVFRFAFRFSEKRGMDGRSLLERSGERRDAQGCRFSLPICLELDADACK